MKRNCDVIEIKDINNENPVYEIFGYEFNKEEFVKFYFDIDGNKFSKD